MKKTYELGWLNPGTKFSFNNLNNYRNLEVKRVSDSGCTIIGEVKNHREDTWRNVGPSYSVSNKALVTID